MSDNRYYVKYESRDMLVFVLVFVLSNHLKSL
jgi:hypothetical protein